MQILTSSGVGWWDPWMTWLMAYPHTKTVKLPTASATSSAKQCQALVMMMTLSSENVGVRLNGSSAADDTLRAGGGLGRGGAGSKPPPKSAQKSPVVQKYAPVMGIH